MSSATKISPEVQLKKIRRLESNMICPNCGVRAPIGLGFGNVCVKFNTFVCDLCKTSHQAISHRVKSISMSNWTMDEVNLLSSEYNGGNEIAIKIWLANAPAFGGKYPGGSRPKEGDRIEVYKKFVIDCYEHGKFKGSTLQDPVITNENLSMKQHKNVTENVKIPNNNNFTLPKPNLKEKENDFLSFDNFESSETMDIFGGSSSNSQIINDPFNKVNENNYSNNHNNSFDLFPPSNGTNFADFGGTHCNTNTSGIHSLSVLPVSMNNNTTSSIGSNKESDPFGFDFDSSATAVSSIRNTTSQSSSIVVTEKSFDPFGDNNLLIPITNTTNTSFQQCDKTVIASSDNYHIPFPIAMNNSNMHVMSGAMNNNSNMHVMPVAMNNSNMHVMSGAMNNNMSIMSGAMNNNYPNSGYYNTMNNSMNNNYMNNNISYYGNSNFGMNNMYNTNTPQYNNNMSINRGITSGNVYPQSISLNSSTNNISSAFSNVSTNNGSTASSNTSSSFDFLQQTMKQQLQQSSSYNGNTTTNIKDK